MLTDFSGGVPHRYAKSELKSKEEIWKKRKLQQWMAERRRRKKGKRGKKGGKGGGAGQKGGK
jgi:hypothetical protein